MAFDADAYAASLTPPTLVVGGRRYVGRILSVEEWAQVWADNEATDHTNLAAVRANTRKVLRAWFPLRTWRDRIRAVVLGHPVIRAFERLPDAAQIAALEDFSRSQRSAMPSNGARARRAGTETTIDPAPPSDG